MEVFKTAKVVRLKSHHDKYLLADSDHDHIYQDRHGSTPNARWTVEFPTTSPDVIRLKSCYDKYLTATNEPYLLGMTGRKVAQTLPRRLDSSVDWEPIMDGWQVKLKTRYGHFLRANGGVPPWRNSITHDIPHRTSTQDWVLWDVEVIEIRVVEQSGSDQVGESFRMPCLPPPPPAFLKEEGKVVGSMSPARFNKEESSSSHGSPHKPDGRTIYYVIANDDGSADTSNGEFSFTFKGNSVAELTQRLKEEAELDDIIVCSKNPLNDTLYPLRLQLPPFNSAMHVVLVQASSKVARSFKVLETTE